jgi:hypothetical protein
MERPNILYMLADDRGRGHHARRADQDAEHWWTGRPGD